MIERLHSHGSPRTRPKGTETPALMALLIQVGSESGQIRLIRNASCLLPCGMSDQCVATSVQMRSGCTIAFPKADFEGHPSTCRGP